MTAETAYANTDFDLKSQTPFDTLHRELGTTCCILHYTLGDDGCWHAIVEASDRDEISGRDAAQDILAMLDAVNALSPTAKAELDGCYFREFNIGFECWDTWGYVHTLPSTVIRAIANAECTVAVTLYPMRNPDGTPKQ